MGGQGHRAVLDGGMTSVESVGRCCRQGREHSSHLFPGVWVAADAARARGQLDHPATLCTPQIGMFSFTGLSPQQVENMTNKVWLKGGGRMAVCAGGSSTADQRPLVVGCLPTTWQPRPERCPTTHPSLAP